MTVILAGLEALLILVIRVRLDLSLRRLYSLSIPNSLLIDAVSHGQ